MTDGSYVLDFASQDIEADGVFVGRGEAWPTLTPGREVSVTAWFGETDVVSSGQTPEQRHAAVLDYVEAAREGAVVVGQNRAGKPYYRERLEASDPSSLVVGVLPSSDLTSLNAQEFWGVIVGGTDVTDAVAARRAIQLDVVVLGLVADYANRSDIEALSQSLL